MIEAMPASYSPEARETIITHVLAELSGGRAVSRILREDDGMPDQATFWRWHFEDEELRGKVAHARENGVESVMDEALAIADTQEMGVIVTDDGEKTTTRKEDMLGHRKLRVETRFKYAQMIAPRKYGPRTLLGSDPDNPMPTGFLVTLVKSDGSEAG
jgi:hypothetical protein